MITRKRIIIVSTFSGIDLLMLAFIRAWAMPGYGLEKNIWAALIHANNFKYPDGTPVMQFIKIDKAEHDILRANKDTEFDSACVDGVYLRGKRVEEANGAEVRAEIERRFGKDICIILLGGPPCQDLCKLNRNKREGERNRNSLLFEYLRFLEELAPDVALMEEAAELGQKEFKGLFSQFLAETKRLPYRVAHMEMNSLHYGSNQQRVRTIVMLVHKALGKNAIFPTPDVVNVKRVRDFLDIQYFHSGNFIDKLKTAGHFMCTVTSGAPQYFIKDGNKYEPAFDDLLLCFDVRKDEYIIPPGVPKQQVRKAIGNAVCVAMAQKLAEIIIKDILCLKHVGDGWFEPIGDTDGDDNNNGKPVIAPSEGPVGDNQTDNANSPIEPISELPKEKTGHIPTEREQPKLIPTPNKNLAPNPKKIINSIELAKMDFDSLNFTDRWADFLGYPSPNFNCVLYGMAGEGKSTFAVQFAKYLADNFGRAIYISGEEGISKTFKDKLIITNSVSPLLDIVHLANLNDVLLTLSRVKYKYVFIDSLDCMNINAADMRRLREAHKSTAFITISQCTKAGEMRGSNQLKHDADICVNVEGGLAVTTKNRFKKKGMRFRVFEDIETSESYYEDNEGNTLVAEKDGAPTNNLNPKRQQEKKVPLEQRTAQELHKLLNKALQVENYEKAAKIRNELERRKKSS